MIFLRYESFRSYIKLYRVTTWILALNIGLFIADKFIFGGRITNWGAFRQIPIFDPYGTLEPWRYVTSITIHANWEHLLFNCFSLFVFAPPLERLLGPARYLAFYVLAGIGGNFLSAIVHLGTYHAAVGASGAIYGIFGAYLYMAVFHKRILDDASRKTVYTILAFGLIYSIIVPRIDIWGHVGGGIAGFAMLGLLERWSKRRR